MLRTLQPRYMRQASISRQTPRPFGKFVVEEAGYGRWHNENVQPVEEARHGRWHNEIEQEGL